MKKYEIMNRLIWILLPMPLLLSNGCDDERVEQSCGCDGKATSIAAWQDGSLYKNTDSAGSYLPKHDFGIWFYEHGEDYTSWPHYLLICNEDSISDFEDIPEFSGIPVKFSGLLKDICGPSIENDTIHYIVLTGIEPGCGCNSSTIDESSEEVGYLSKYANNENSDSLVFRIRRSVGGMDFDYYVCNDSYLTNFVEIPVFPDELKVKFSGKLKLICEGSGPTTYLPYNIFLTSLEEL
jgi:hypothetical protein